MVKLARSSFIKSSLLALMLGGCVQQPPYSIGLDVLNTATAVSDEVDAPMACAGGVQASLSLAGASVTTPLAQPLPAENNTVLEDFIVPSSARFGMPLVTEARCYDEVGNEIGYVEVDRPMRRGHIPRVSVIAPLAVRPTFDDAYECTAPATQRGVELCVLSQLY